MATETEKKDNIVDFSDRKTVVGKKGAKFLVEGKEYELHPVNADKLIKNGEAELKK